MTVVNLIINPPQVISLTGSIENGIFIEVVPSAGGAGNFIELADVPQSYDGEAGNAVVVKADESGLEFVPASGTGDMTKAVYDPTGINADAFDYNNFTNIPTIPPEYTDAMADARVVAGITGKVDKVTGKELSDNNYTDAEQLKLQGIASGAEVNVNADWNSISGDSQILNKPTISGSNTGDETAQRIGTLIAGSSNKATPIDADRVGYSNSESTNNLFYSTWTQIKAFLKTYFDTVYTRTNLGINNVDNTSDLNKPISTAQQNILDVQKEPTGFISPELVIINYNSATQRVTITGTPTARYRGVLVSALISGFISDPHPNVTGHVYYLYYNGSAFVWSDNLFPGFDQLLICFVFYRASNPFATRECHGLQTWQCHQTDHYNIGTYRTSGGDISAVVPASTTAADRRPDISACTIYDEDLQTINPALTSKLYSQRFMTLTNTINYTLGASDIVPLSGANPYYNAWNGSAFIQTLLPANGVMTVWLYEVPVTSDAQSQAIRHIFVQGQSFTQAANSSAGAITTARNTEKAKTSVELNLGDPNVVSAEYVVISKFIIVYTGGNWYISDVITITGNKANQTGTSAGSFLSSVSASAPITGSGIVSDPLAIAPATTINDGYMTQAQATKLAGLHQVTVSATEPLNPVTGDIWIDIS